MTHFVCISYFGKTTHTLPTLKYPRYMRGDVSDQTPENDVTHLFMLPDNPW